VKRLRDAALALAAAGLGVGLFLAVAEVLLRFLPVRSAMLAQPVSESAPVFRLAPNRSYVYSRGWDFNMANAGRVNGAGYVNDAEYVRADPRPLLAVIGDSFVEAVMVPFAETLQARLATAFAPARRVYSFAASGAPLSQYVVWAEHAVREYGADSLVVVVVGNDFAESLVSFGRKPGFHQYARAPDGRLVLERNDFRPDWRRALAANSALFRYVWLNLQLPDLAAALRTRGHEPAYAGFVAAQAAPDLVADSLAAVEAFLVDISARTGLTPDRIAFVVDGFRYPDAARAQPDSYFATMRGALISGARARGHVAVDMDETFFAEHAVDGRKFEFPRDGHWSGVGHAAAAAALLRTPFAARLTPPR